MLRSRSPRISFRRRAGTLALLLWTGAAQGQDAGYQRVSRAARQTYDIPAQRLSIALATFSQISGVDVLLDEPDASGRQSGAVRGSYSPPQALTILLKGTGLVARFTSARSAVIVPQARAHAALPGLGRQAGPVIALDMMQVTAPRVIGGKPAADPAFLLAMAARIRALVVDAGAIGRGDRQRMRIQTRIRADGTLYEVRVARSDGDKAGDARIVSALDGALLGLALPPGLRQPILFDVAAQ